MSEQAQESETRKKCQPWGLRQHDEEILTLRLSGWTLRKIADKFGTTPESIRNAVARQLLSIKRRERATQEVA